MMMNTLTPIRSLLRRLRRENDGASLIELGLALPLLMLLLLGMIDISRLVANTIDVEQSAQRITDYALAVRPPSNSTTYLQNEATRFIDANTDRATIRIFLECDGVAQSFNTVCADGADTARMVGVRVQRQMDYLFDWGYFAAYFGANGMGSTATVNGDSIVRFQ
jgi:Flp pilus assembly protein TadG